MTYLILMLNTVFKLIKAGKTIEDHALRELAVMIIEDFEWLTFPDVKLCLRNGIKGKYGEVFDRVDVQVIYRWFEAYKEERLAASEKLRRELKRALDIDMEENAVPMPEDIKKKFEILENKMRTNEEKAAKFEPSISKKINHLRT